MADPTPALRPSRRQFLRAGSAGMVLAWATACADDSSESGATDENLGFAGTVLGDPLPKPSIIFSDTSGRPYDIAKETAGKLALVLFGFTNCTDVCPVHLSILAATLKHMSGPASKATVIFVGVDTKRDTPEAMRKFLDERSRAFVGLTQSPTNINAALAQLKFPPVVIGEPEADGTYSVGHPSQILAYTPDDKCHIVYPFGVVQEQWAKDLPRLETFQWPNTHRS